MRGTFAPFLRASESPIATACFLLVTFLPERPDLSVPRFFLCIAFFTELDAFELYFFLVDFFGINTPQKIGFSLSTADFRLRAAFSFPR